MEEVKTPKIEWILKECPFCGGEARVVDPEIGVYWASCKKCGAATMPRENEYEAASLWDERIVNKDIEVSKVFDAILQRMNEAKKTECIKDPLGYALYYAWKDREREKIK